MIAFASLFLGLVLGTRPVELVVGNDVAAVELRLDGAELVTLRRPPWTTEVAFGSELVPRHLEAVAFDAERQEIGRVSQWLNLPQPRAVASVVLEGGQHSPGEPRVARISWESSVGAEPESWSVVLDGTPLPVKDVRRVELPPVDEKSFHLLHVELRFKGRVTSRVDVTFGGTYVDEVSTEITALALLADRVSPPRGDKARAKAPGLTEVQGWIQKGGESIRVLAVEKETAEIVMIMDRPFPHMLEPGERYKPPKALYLGPEERFRFASTVPETSQGVATSFELFPISPDYGAEVIDELYGMLSRLVRHQSDRRPRPATAVAVAGLAAYEGRHRRAVVLIPSSKPPEDDGIHSDEARRYLDRLGVPFFVWNPKSHNAPHVEAWGEVRSVGSLKQLATAFEELRDVLDRQWIVWLEGRHLPQDITLSAEARGFTLLR